MSARWNALAVGTLVLALSGPLAAQDGMMMGMPAADIPTVPVVTGFSSGEEILFMHTEASDRDIAGLLTDMMGSPVLFVPALANVSPEVTAPVYVFANGVTPDGARGPLGFQPDIFPSPAGSEGYTPLREVVLVTWTGTPRVLRSADEVAAAATNGELMLEPTGTIVNMPMVTWPGGTR